MKNTLNLVVIFAIGLAFALGCSNSSASAPSDDDPNARKVERGRLKFVITATSIHTSTTPIYRSVQSDFYVNGKRWAPKDDKDFANKFDMCDTNPNPNLEILRCPSGWGEDPKATYILRMKNDQPEIVKIEAGNDGTWIDDDGQWLLFKKLYYNIVTDEKIEVKGMPFADEQFGSSPVQYVLGVSPDKKTVVTRFDSIPHTESKNGKESTEKFMTLWIVDTEKGVFEKRKVSFTKNPWLSDYKQPEDDFVPPAETYRHFVWKKDANGKDQLIVPELLEKVER